MKIIIYSTKSFEKEHITEANQGRHELRFVLDKLSLETVDKASGYDVVSCSVKNNIDDQLLAYLTKNGVRFITLRSTGCSSEDVVAAQEFNNLLHTYHSHNKQFLNLRCA